MQKHNRGYIKQVVLALGTLLIFICILLGLHQAAAEEPKPAAPLAKAQQPGALRSRRAQLEAVVNRLDDDAGKLAQFARDWYCASYALNGNAGFAMSTDISKCMFDQASKVHLATNSLRIRIAEAFITTEMLRNSADGLLQVEADLWREKQYTAITWNDIKFPDSKTVIDVQSDLTSVATELREISRHPTANGGIDLPLEPTPKPAPAAKNVSKGHSKPSPTPSATAKKSESRTGGKATSTSGADSNLKDKRNSEKTVSQPASAASFSAKVAQKTQPSQTAETGKAKPQSQSGKPPLSKPSLSKSALTSETSKSAAPKSAAGKPAKKPAPHQTETRPSPVAPEPTPSAQHPEDENY